MQVVTILGISWKWNERVTEGNSGLGAFAQKHFKATFYRTSENILFAKQNIGFFTIDLYIEKEKLTFQFGFSDLQTLRMRKMKALLIFPYYYWIPAHDGHLVWKVMEKIAVHEFLRSWLVKKNEIGLRTRFYF